MPISPEELSSQPVRYAGFWIRLAASLIDSAVLFIPWCLIVLFAVVAIRLLAATEHFDSGAALLVALPATAVVTRLLYFSLMESSARQATFGKMAFGLRVTDLEGRRLSQNRATGRTLAKLLSGLTFGIGYIVCGFTRRKQALHDIVARCLVVRPPVTR